MAPDKVVILNIKCHETLSERNETKNKVDADKKKRKHGKIDSSRDAAPPYLVRA